MKALILLICIAASFSTLTQASSTKTWTTEGLNDTETQVIDEASQAEILELSDCMSGQNEIEISNTSCINEVFGDVHN